jgi:hypothetical protein
MSPLSPSALLSSSFLRTVAIAALMGTTLLAGPTIARGADAPGQTQGLQKSPNKAATGMKGETVEARITKLHADLKITPDEQVKWDAVAQTMRDNAVRMEKLVATKRAQAPQNLTAVDDLANYEEFAQAHLTGLKNLTSVFKALYDTMPDAQKKNADKVFLSFGETASAAPKKS